MADPVSIPNQSGNASGSYEAFASLNEGFLGTGYTTAVELSFIAMALILGYVGVSTFRYLLPDFSIFDSVSSVLGLRDR